MKRAPSGVLEGARLFFEENTLAMAVKSMLAK